MLAERYLQRRYIEGKAKGEAETLSAVEEALKHDRNSEEARRIIERAREIMRGNGSDNLTPNLPTDT